MSSNLNSVWVLIGTTLIVAQSPLFAAEKDVNVINTPDVNVVNSPDVFVANTPDVMVQNTIANPVPVNITNNDNGITPYQRRFQVTVSPSGDRLIGSINIDQTIPAGKILRVKAVNFGGASSNVSTDVSVEVVLQNMLPFARQNFFDNMSMPNASGVRVRGHYMTEFLIWPVQHPTYENIEITLRNVTLVERVVEITLTGELLPAS